MAAPLLQNSPIRRQECRMGCAGGHSVCLVHVYVRGSPGASGCLVHPYRAQLTSLGLVLELCLLVSWNWGGSMEKFTDMLS
jgi:hypothetical protein